MVGRLRRREARRAAIVAAVAVTSLLVVAPAKAVDTRSVVGSWASAEQFHMDGYTVNITVERAGLGAPVFCAHAHKVTSVTETQWTTVTENTCWGGDSVEYHFDSLGWVVSVSGTQESLVDHEVNEPHPEHERGLVSRTSAPGTVSLHMTWRGVGDPQVAAQPEFQFPCYMTVLCPGGRAAVSKAALVSGEVVFHGLGLRAGVQDHPGTIAIEQW